MTNITERIIKKIENSYVIWFEESNCWIQFKDPAFFVYKLYSNAIDPRQISLKCKRKYGLSETESNRFVNEIIEGIRKYSSVKTSVPDISAKDIKLGMNFTFNPEAAHLYLMNSKRIEINFETNLTGYYLHPFLEHLEIKNHNKADLSFEIFTYKNFHVLRIKGKPEKCWFFEEFNQLKQRLFIEISNAIYEKDEDDWMSFIHASAVTDKKQTILFSSASGSGKSTIVGLLMKNGLQIVSDDFIFLDSRFKLAYPFPAALSIKQGAYNLFNSLELKPLYYHGLRNNTIRYLDPQINNKLWYKGFPVNKIVFIKYKPEIKTRFKELSVLEALPLFYEQSKVSSNIENTRRFINWFMKVKCYYLEYSENDKVIQKIIGLFGRK
jgi:hypothetical protein